MLWVNKLLLATICSHQICILIAVYKGDVKSGLLTFQTVTFVKYAILTAILHI